MTPFRVSITAAIAAVILLLVIFELIRSRRLQERYALLWLLTGVVIGAQLVPGLTPAEFLGLVTNLLHRRLFR